MIFVNYICSSRQRLQAAGRWTQAFVLVVVGGLAATAFPPVHFLPFLVPAFVVLFWMTDAQATRWQAFRVGWLFGLGHFSVGFYWVGHAFLVDSARYGWMAPGAVLGLAAGLALFPGFVSLVSKFIMPYVKTTRPGQILVFAMVWTGFEWVRSWILTGFPWNQVGSVWANSDVMMQFASVAGVLGLSLITLIAATLPAVLGFPASAARDRLWSLAGFGGLAIIAGFGLWRLLTADLSYLNDVTLRLVQPNIPQHLKWRSDLKWGHVRKLVALSRQPSENGRPPTHIIWPETAVPYNLQYDPDLLKALGPVVPPSGYLITGAPRSNRSVSKSPEAWNSLLAITAGGTVAAVYDKVHLVPFGEYVPWRSVLDITKLTAGRSDFSVGRTARTLSLPGLPAFSPLICYEIIFADQVRSLGTAPKWLLNITNDAWFGASSGPYQHLALAQFRAVEMGLPVVRVANTGISALIGPHGRVIEQLDLGRQGVLDVGLPRALREQTLYARYGDRLVVLMLLICGAVVILFAVRGNRLAQE